VKNKHFTNLTGSGKIKIIEWHPKALDVIRQFPEEARRKVGQLLRILEDGQALAMPHSRPMPGVDRGVHELRVRASDGAFRVFYLLRIEVRILVFHAFVKKDQQTSANDMKLGKKRLKELLGE
jgi:phage-related protein